MSAAHYESITGITNTIYSDAKQADFGFISSAVLILYVSGTNAITFSFDGKNDHGVLNDDGFSLRVYNSTINTKDVFLKGGIGDEIIEISAIPRQ
jgi:hypothetical protein